MCKVNSRDHSEVTGVKQLYLKWDIGGVILCKFVLLGFEGFWGGCLLVFSLLFVLLGCFCSLGYFCYSSLLRSFLCFEGFYISLGVFVCLFQG